MKRVSCTNRYIIRMESLSRIVLICIALTITTAAFASDDAIPYRLAVRDNLSTVFDVGELPYDDTDRIAAWSQSIWPEITANGASLEQAARRFNTLAGLYGTRNDYYADQLESWYWINPIGEPPLSAMFGKGLESMVTMSIGLAEKYIISVCWDRYVTLGGAHGTTSLTMLNFDMTAGIAFDMDYLINDYYAFYQYAVSAVKRQINEDIDMFFDYAAETVTASAILEHAYFTKEGMIIGFDQGEIAPMAGGNSYFIITYSEMKPFLNDKGRQLLAFAYGPGARFDAAIIGERHYFQSFYNQLGRAPGYVFELDDPSETVFSSAPLALIGDNRSKQKYWEN